MNPVKLSEKQLDNEEFMDFLQRHNELRADNEELKNTCKKLSMNQLLLGVAVVIFGIASIASTIVAVKTSKNMVVGIDGILLDKDTGKEVVVHSKGVSVVSEVKDFLDEEGQTVECFRIADIATLYKAFEEGTDARVLTNVSDGSIGDSVTKIQGANAFTNETHVIIGDLVLDISPENLCNNGDEEFPDGSHAVFHDHLEWLHGSKNNDEIHRVQECYGYGRRGGYGGYGYGRGWSF